MGKISPGLHRTRLFGFGILQGQQGQVQVKHPNASANCAHSGRSWLGPCQDAQSSIKRNQKLRMICVTCYSSLALTGSEQLFTSDFSARITSGRRGQTCHIKKIPILAESHRSDSKHRATKATSLQGQSCRAKKLWICKSKSIWTWDQPNPKQLLLDMAAAASTPPAAASQCFFHRTRFTVNRPAHLQVIGWKANTPQLLSGYWHSWAVAGQSSAQVVWAQLITKTSHNISL